MTSLCVHSDTSKVTVLNDKASTGYYYCNESITREFGNRSLDRQQNLFVSDGTGSFSVIIIQFVDSLIIMDI